MARFSFDVAIPPEERTITEVRAGEWNLLDEPLWGLNVGDVVNQAILTAKIDPAETDADPDTIQLIIDAVTSADGVIVVDGDEPTARWLRFNISPDDATLLLNVRYFDVAVWVTRGGVTRDRTILRGVISAKPSSTSTITLLDEGPADDVLAFIENMGGDGVVLAAYSTKDGISGAAHASVIHSGGVVDEWRDYRGVGFAPLLAGSGSARPAWNGGTLEITGDGSDDFLVTALNAIFDLDGPKTLIVIAKAPTLDNYIAAISSSASAERLLGIDRSTGGAGGRARTRVFPNGGAVDSGVAPGDATRRVFYGSTNGGVQAGSQVGGQARVNGAVDNIGPGNNYLAMFGYGVEGSKSASSIVGVYVLNRDYTELDEDVITAFAINHHGAIAA